MGTARTEYDDCPNTQFQVEDLEGPYSKYCDAFATGFDQWDVIQNNTKLPPILAELSTAIPPPPNTEPPIWTLDALFLLPRTRLKYYKKLYARLLKSTNPGRSDHRLLMNATETLDTLFVRAESRLDVIVGQGNDDAPPPPPMKVGEVDRDLPPPPLLGDRIEGRDSYGSSGRASSRSSA
jgi:hypothetical protein